MSICRFAYFNPRSVSTGTLSQANFNPRSPCGERHAVASGGTVTSEFQPSLPLRGATSPDGAEVGRVLISTLAPLAGSDQGWISKEIMDEQFQPSLPLRGATRPREGGRVDGLISTLAPLAWSDGGDVRPRLRHGISTLAPLAGSDFADNLTLTDNINFNPRSPCGERHHVEDNPTMRARFQPSLPLRGATMTASEARADFLISTLAPLAGSDRDAMKRPAD